MRNDRTPMVAVVDDDQVYQFTASRALKATNLPHRIVQFRNGQEALTYLGNHLQSPGELPDIILLDINMPITDGWMFLDEYFKMKKSLTKHIRIYMVSSSIDPRDLTRAKENPDVADYVEKPISLAKFSELLGT